MGASMRTDSDSDRRVNRARRYLFMLLTVYTLPTTFPGTGTDLKKIHGV